MVASQREKLGLLEAVDQPADIRPVERSGAHRAGLARRDQRAGPEKLRRVGCRRAPRKFGLGVMHGVDIALAHEDRVVGADQHSTERMMAMRDRVACNGICSEEVSDHPVTRHIAQVKAREMA